MRCSAAGGWGLARLDKIYAAFRERGAVLLTACPPDPGAMLGLPGALARPLARRQRAVNTVVHALSERHGGWSRSSPRP